MIIKTIPKLLFFLGLLFHYCSFSNVINNNMKKVVVNSNQDKPLYICGYKKHGSFFIGTTSDDVTCNVVQPSNDFAYLVQ